METFTSAFRSQYTAALSMIRESITVCPETVWNDSSYGNRFWHLAYHSLFFTAFYLSPNMQESNLAEILVRTNEK